LNTFKLHHYPGIIGKDLRREKAASVCELFDMTCAAKKQFDGKVAERDLKRYRRRGPDAVTRLMLAELRRWPLQGEDLLDVGSGIGVIGAELADAGLASATLVDASPAYLGVARAEIELRYESRPTRFLLGDFAMIADTLTDADVVTLDRVVCCYPDAEALLRGAASRTRRLLAFSYPRDRWYMWILTALENFWRRLRGSPFRTFVHWPERMGAALEAAGLVRVARQGTLVWVLDLYRRREVV
jgi:2-polyprenyl-3-methyl-5-hydroxy-6-metoxy-1,4-benzoquinol methylase